MNESVIEPVDENYIHFRVLLLEFLDEDGSVVGRSTGFAIMENDFLSLYTCWHAVTGVDPNSVPPSPKITRRKVRVVALKQETRALGVASIGGRSELVIDLYDQQGNPNWIQQQSEDSETIISVPVFDCVRLNLSEFEPEIPFFFARSNDISIALRPGRPARIVGFPYGYFANPASPFPIWLSRWCASKLLFGGIQLLDGPGAPCMSGSPIVTKVDGEWRLIGIYTGVVYPEHQHFKEILTDKGTSNLPLGKFIGLTIARSVLGANPHDDPEPVEIPGITILK